MRGRAHASDHAEFVSNLKHVAFPASVVRLTLLAMPASARGHASLTESARCLTVWMYRWEST